MRISTDVSDHRCLFPFCLRKEQSLLTNSPDLSGLDALPGGYQTDHGREHTEHFA
jgi:hypothetical protein